MNNHNQNSKQYVFEEYLKAIRHIFKYAAKTNISHMYFHSISFDKFDEKFLFKTKLDAINFTGSLKRVVVREPLTYGA
jgi:hypothetical protein